METVSITSTLISWAALIVSVVAAIQTVRTSRIIARLKAQKNIREGHGTFDITPAEREEYESSGETLDFSSLTIPRPELLKLTDD